MHANVNTVTCKSILNRSGIAGVDYTVNPYTGCLHGCAYCYARFMGRYTRHHLPWGTFCDVKANAVAVLRKQARRLPKGLVSLSTVTDPYQPPERSYGLTRSILAELSANGFAVSVLTKSDLVLRDIDLLGAFHRESCEVGFSINTLDEDLRRLLEPGAPTVARRLDALNRIAQQGIRTWVFIAPLLPGTPSRHVAELLDRLRKAADTVLIDRLNIKAGNWSAITRALRRHPGVLSEWRRILFSEDRGQSWYDRAAAQICEYGAKRGLSVAFC